MNCFLKMIIGFIFLSFDLRVNFGGFVVDILSDVIGYGFIIWSCKEMLEWSPCFKKTRKHAIIAVILCILKIAAENMKAGFTINASLTGLETIAFIYTTYYILEGLYVKNKTEKIYEISAQLKGSWIAMAVSSFLYSFLSMSDLSAVVEEMNLPGLDTVIMQVLSVVSFAVQIFFMLTLNQNRILLDERTKKNQNADKKDV